MVTHPSFARAIGSGSPNSSIMTEAMSKPSVTAALATLASCVGLLSSTAARAEPPNLNILESEAREIEADLSAYFAPERESAQARGWLVPELSYGPAEGIGLQLQATVRREGGEMRFEEVEAQAFLRLAGTGDGASAGLSVETSVDTGDEAPTLGLLGYGILQTDSWFAAGNAGVARSLSSSATSLPYAWTVQRRVAPAWQLGLEGGGEIRLRQGERTQSYLGPSLSYQTAGDAELSAGFLATPFDRSPNLVRIALAVAF